MYLFIVRFVDFSTENSLFDIGSLSCQYTACPIMCMFLVCRKVKKVFCDLVSSLKLLFKKHAEDTSKQKSTHHAFGK